MGQPSFSGTELPWSRANTAVLIEILHNQFQVIHHSLPFVRRMVVLNAALHVLQFIQHGKHVDEFAQREQVRL